MFETVGGFDLLVIAAIGLLVLGPRDFWKYAQVADEIRRRFRK